MGTGLWSIFGSIPLDTWCDFSENCKIMEGVGMEKEKDKGILFFGSASASFPLFISWASTTNLASSSMPLLTLFLFLQLEKSPSSSFSRQHLPSTLSALRSSPHPPPTSSHHPSPSILPSGSLSSPPPPPGSPPSTSSPPTGSPRAVHLRQRAQRAVCSHHVQLAEAGRGSGPAAGGHPHGDLGPQGAVP